MAKDALDDTTPDSGPAPHQPYVPDEVVMPEFTFSALLAGVVLGIIFGASSLYLVLKVGITVSASIPVAVISITLFRALSRLFGIRPATILENNIVQTAGSAGESIAFGVGVTMPALMLLGFDMSIGRVMTVSVLGGTLGILMMIPLRRAFIVRMHGPPGHPGTLLYPEGTACAQVLISGDKGGASGQTVFVGFGVAFAHKFISEGMGLLRASVSLPLGFFSRVAALSGDLASEFLGVGYIIGVRTASIMMAGGVLGYLVIIPLIALFGDSVPELIFPGKKRISEMNATDIRNSYLLYIGAGCVATAGIISMVRTLPMILRSIASGMASLRSGPVSATGETGVPRLRTEDDLPMSLVLLGSLGLVAALAVIMMQEVSFQGALIGALLVVLFGFLFVTVSSRLTGEIGSSSNPISGMTVATLLLTCLIFLGLNWVSPLDRVLALTIGAVVCIAASNGGTTSQDLKTGFLVGATPRLQQWAIIIGALTSALVIGFTLVLFNQAGTVYSQKNLPDVNLADRLASMSTEVYDGQTYHVWYATDEDEPKVTPGKYLVDADGRVRYLVDPSITGVLTHRDDGEDVKLKFEAPKTQLMSLIINGVLKQKLNWGLVLMGAMIAVTLELCGVSSLAFAVGVYIPMSATVPIFLGGLTRWGVDGYMKWRRRRMQPLDANGKPKGQNASEAEAIAESETSPGVLLSSGYVAGGTIGGVLIAFLEFAPGLKERIAAPGLWAEGTWMQDQVLAIALFAALIAGLWFVGTRRKPAAD